MQWIFHCFRMQIDSVGVFVWALAPFLCLGVFVLFASLFSAGETQVWLGDLRVVAFCVVVVSLFWFNRFADFKDCASLYRVFAAYSHVRTEPLARHRPHSREKNAENKTEQKSAAKHRQRLLKAPKSRQARMCVFPQAYS